MKALAVILILGATRSTTVELCSLCDQPAKYRVELKREGPLVWCEQEQAPERTYRPAGFAWRCWGHNWTVLPMTEADRRTSESVMLGHGWWWAE